MGQATQGIQISRRKRHLPSNRESVLKLRRAAKCGPPFLSWVMDYRLPAIELRSPEVVTSEQCHAANLLWQPDREHCATLRCVGNSQHATVFSDYAMG